MIFLNRLDGTEIVLNSDLIVTIERTPDTMLTLTTGGRLLVREGPDEIIERIVAFRRTIYRGPLVDVNARR